MRLLSPFNVIYARLCSHLQSFSLSRPSSKLGLLTLKALKMEEVVKVVKGPHEAALTLSTPKPNYEKQSPVRNTLQVMMIIEVVVEMMMMIMMMQL